MTGRSGRAPRRETSAPGASGRPRGRAEIQYAPDFEDDLRRLGDPKSADGSWVFQQTRSFAAEWTAGRFEQELRKAWGYKTLTCPRAGKEKLVWQITIGQYRVMLTVLAVDPPILRFLEVFRKSPNTLAQRLERACPRARQLRREIE